METSVEERQEEDCSWAEFGPRMQERRSEVARRALALGQDGLLNEMPSRHRLKTIYELSVSPGEDRHPCGRTISLSEGSLHRPRLSGPGQTFANSEGVTVWLRLWRSVGG
jgi:hypothetical protein